MTIHHIIKSRSLNSDGRLLKWINSLNENSVNSSVLIIEDRNKSGEVLEGTTKITKIKLLSRKIFKKRKGYFLKVPEYAIKCLRYLIIEQPKIIVFHDVQQYLNLLISIILVKPISKSKIVWDLHELPHVTLSKFYFTKIVVKFILSRCDLLIYTNEERRKFILKTYNHKENEYFILNNFPNDKFIFSERKSLSRDMEKWLNGEPYILWLGAAIEARNFSSILSVYNNVKNDYKLIILGNVAEEFSTIIALLKLNDRVFTDFVDQSKLINYIDNAKFSVVLYKSFTPNNMYCEPNRLYQLLSRNIPIICGNNPPMKKHFNYYKHGVLLPDDGSSHESMAKAFAEIIQNYNLYIYNIPNLNHTLFSWDKQFKELIIKKNGTLNND